MKMNLPSQDGWNAGPQCLVLHLFLLILVGKVSAIELGDQTKPKKDRFYAVMQATSKWSFWNPGLSASNPAMSFRTEGLSSYEVQGLVGYGGCPIASLSYEGPLLSGNNHQREILAANRTQQAGLEKYTAGIAPEPLLSIFFPRAWEGIQGSHLPDSWWSNGELTVAPTEVLAVAGASLMRTIASVQFFHSEALFFGTAHANSPFLFLPTTASVDPNGVASGGTRVEAGSGVSFKTLFKEDDITVSVWDWSHYNLRVGVYDLEWSRPSENNHAPQPGQLPFLFETRYESRGLHLAVQNSATETRGFNYDFTLQYGMQNKITSASGRSLGVQYDSLRYSLDYLGLKGSAWYNWRLGGTASHEYLLAVGAMADARSWTVSYPANGYGPGTQDKSVGSEFLYSLWTRIGYRFQ